MKAIGGALATGPLALVLFSLLAAGGDPPKVWTSDGWQTWNQSGEALRLLAGVLVAMTLSFAVAGWATVKMGSSMAAGIADSGA